MSRRAKFVLGVDLVRRALDLGPDLRVVMLHVTRDPDALHVTVEGEGVPVLSGRVDVGDDAVLAWRGLMEAPVLAWPQPAGPRPADDAVEVNVCRVDESVGEAAQSVGAAEPTAARGMVAVEDAGAAAVGRAWEAVVEAVRGGVPAGTVLHAMEDAVAEGLRLGRRELSQEVLAVVDRLRVLLTDQAAAEKGGRR